MNSEIANNKVYLQGVVQSLPEINHTVKDEEFYGFNLSVSRLSGQNDVIPIIISKNLNTLDFYSNPLILDKLFDYFMIYYIYIT